MIKCFGMFFFTLTKFRMKNNLGKYLWHYDPYIKINIAYCLLKMPIAKINHILEKLLQGWCRFFKIAILGSPLVIAYINDVT